MENLHWELSVLSRSVAYKNLSGAAMHVGLSQPQLSRIIAKIEQQLNIVLLDRSAKRKTGWFPIAFQLSELYAKSNRYLDKEMQLLLEGNELSHVRIGTLEGLVDHVLPFAKKLFQDAKTVDIAVHDLNPLEELFFKGEFDFIFISHEPGRRKFKYIKTIGYQTLDLIEKNKKYSVMSSFEFGTKKKEQALGEKILISNSLSVRKRWMDDYGGAGIIPSAVKKEKNMKAHSVYIIGSDLISEKLWRKVVESSLN